MNPTGKKLISLFLVFALLTINCASLRTTFGKERLGATLFITKRDGKTISGRLFAVKENSLLLSPGQDLSIDIKDIEKIVVVKKSKAGLGAGIGFLIGGGGGALIGFIVGKGEVLVPPFIGSLGAIVGILFGVLIGIEIGADKTFQLEGMTDSEIQETLDKLRKRARIRDYK